LGSAGELALAYPQMKPRHPDKRPKGKLTVCEDLKLELLVFLAAPTAVLGLSFPLLLL
jgi:hypothetical protein